MKELTNIISVSLILAVILAGTAAGDAMVQGDQFTITGELTGNPDDIMWYLFGNNYFTTGTEPVVDNKYQIVFSKDTTKNMDPGKYCLIVQHPMYDKTFNVGPIWTGSGYDIVACSSGPYTSTKAEVLFNTNGIQSSQSATALRNAVSSQNIDDQIISKDLELITRKETESIPNTIHTGEPLIISGTTSGHRNEIVTVELWINGFTPSEKNSEISSSSGKVKSTRIGESGNWSITFDTNGFEPGNYEISITVGHLSPINEHLTILPMKTPTPTISSPTPATLPQTPSNPADTKTPESPLSPLVFLPVLILPAILRK